MAFTPPTTPSSTCTECGAVIQDGARFCDNCGALAPLVSPVSVKTCMACGAQLSATAQFCRKCGTQATVAAAPGAPSASNCMACGAQLSPTAQFCRKCGTQATVAAAPGAPSASNCLACGAQLSATAQFCRKCGTPTGGSAPKVRMAGGSRGFSRRLGVTSSAALLAIAVAAVAVVVLHGRGGDPGDPPLESRATVVEPADPNAVGPSGLPMRPHVRLDHSGGASADIPAGESLYGETIDLRKVELSADRYWEHGGTGWELVSYAGVVIAGTATVDLPSGSTTGDRVIVRSPSGMWLELPAEHKTLANGKPGFRVSVTGVPAPWTFAIAHPKPGAPAISAAEQDDLRVEQLYWTDRAAWQKEIEAWLKTAQLSTVYPVPVGLVASVPMQASLPDRYEAISVEYRKAIKMLGAGRGGVREAAAGDKPIGALAITPRGLYSAGIKKLVAVRDSWVQFRGSIPQLDKQSPDFQVAVYLMDEWIETGLAAYAPWGLDLVNQLLDEGALKDLDLRVLKPYGEILWTDVALKEGAVPGVDAAIQDALASGGEARIVDGQAKVTRSLRLYSTRAVERLAIIDWLKDNVEVWVRWLPVGLALIGVVPGAVGASVVFAGVDQLVNWVQSWYDASEGSPYAFIGFEGGSAGGSSLSFVVDMKEERVLMAKEGRAMLPSHGLTIAQFAYSVGMFAAVRFTDWYAFKGIRELTAGTRGYCTMGHCNQPLNHPLSDVIPPVVIHARATGPLQQPEGAYLASVDRLMVWNLQRGTADLNRDWLGGEAGPRGALADLPFEDYHPDRWPVTVAKTEPDAQAMRIGIPRSYLEGVEKVNGVKPGSLLFHYRMALRLETSEGEHNIFELIEEAKPLPTDKKDFVYVAAVLRKPGIGMLSWLPPAYDGDQQQAATKQLKVKLKGQLSAQGQEESEYLTFDAEFTPKSVLARLDPDDPKSPRVNYLDMELGTSIFGTYRIDKFTLLGGDPELAKGYQSGHLLYTKRSCETVGACTLQVVARTAEKPIRYRASLCSSTSCDHVADSEPYDIRSPLGKATAHAQVFSLDKNTLTGTFPIETGSNPGEPAIVFHWRDIKAEFKGTRVTGTFTDNQLLYDVVNGKLTNVRTITLNFSFEGTKVK